MRDCSSFRGTDAAKSLLTVNGYYPVQRMPLCPDCRDDAMKGLIQNAEQVCDECGETF